jgi:predicted oxidoreductase
MMKHRMSPMAWSPLGGGKYFDDDRTNISLQNLANQYQSTPSQLLLAWLLKHPSTIFPLSGSTKPERLEEVAKSLHINLEKQHWFEMLKWVTGKDVA